MHKSAVLLKGPITLDLGKWIKTFKRKVALKQECVGRAVTHEIKAL